MGVNIKCGNWHSDPPGGLKGRAQGFAGVFMVMGSLEQ